MTTLSHQHFSSYDEAYNEIKGRIMDNKNLRVLIEKLAKTEFGRFLIQHRGLNAYWTDVMVNFPTYTNVMRGRYTTWEQDMLDNFPSARATQKRFVFFKDSINEQVKNNSKILCAPSGLLPELVQINEMPDIQNVNIVAVDIDSQAQALLKSRLKGTKLEEKVQYICDICNQLIYRYTLKN